MLELKQLGEFTCRRLVSEVCQHSQWSCPWADMAVEPKLSVQGRKGGPSDRKGCRDDNKKWVPLSGCYGMNWVPPSLMLKLLTPSTSECSDRGFTEMIKLKCSHLGGSLSNLIVAIRTDTVNYGGETMWGHREESHQQAKERSLRWTLPSWALEETGPANILVSEF